jgi:peptide/nickel transport system permease protein
VSSFLRTKIIRSLVTLWLVVTLTFIALHLSGDPVLFFVGDDAPPSVVEYYRVKFGFDRSLPEQYFTYLANIAQGDFGLSLASRKPASALILEALPRTAQLGITAYVGGLLIGIALGIAAALNHNRAVDRFVMGFAVFGFSIPNFFFGILLILFFVLHWRLLPSSGSGSWRHLILPALTMGLAFAGTFARITRSAMLEVVDKPYMLAARARGVPRLRRIVRHALPNAMIPIVTIAGLKFGDVVGGAIVVESVFAWPGIGRLLVNAVTTRDFAVVQALVILIAVTMIVVNILVDLVYVAIDPRMRATR